MTTNKANRFANRSGPGRLPQSPVIQVMSQALHCLARYEDLPVQI